MGNPRSKFYAECPHCETPYNPSTVQSDACVNCGGSLSTPGLPVDNDPSFDAPDYQVSPAQLEAMPVQHTKTMSLLKKGYTMTNQGYGANSKCYKCQQPIEEGQLSTWEGGMECHAGGCPRPAQQPQQTPAQRIQNMPQRGKPKTPAQLGLQPRQPEVGYVASTRKKAIGLQNQGQPDAVCPKCQQPIADGQMVNYPQGKETHVQCPPATGQQPGQGAPGSGYESRLNLPPGFKRPQPQQSAPGMISPSAGAPRAGSLLEKKADSRFIDDEWRAILEHYGFRPEGQPNSEIWWNQEIPVRIKIDSNPESGAFWVAMTNEGNPLESGSDTHRLEMQLESIAASLEPKEEIAWKGDVPEFSDSDKDFMKDFRIKGSRIAKVTVAKTGARKPNFGFAVPLKSAGAVAFHLAKAGMKDFEVIHYENDDSSVFAFTNEPEMHLGEEIVRAEFQDQIASRKGMWGSWTESAKQMEDPSLVKSEQELHTPTASDEKTADDPNSYLRGKNVSGPQLVKSRYDHALEVALDALDTLAEVGPSEDIAGCAQMSAADLRQFAKDHSEGNARKFSSDGGKTVYCCVLGHVQMTAASTTDIQKKYNTPVTTEDIAKKYNTPTSTTDIQKKYEKKSAIEKQALDANLVTLIGTFVGAVLVKWLGQEYSKRWGNLAQKAEAKAWKALQEGGVYDLATLDKYAEDNGTSQIGAFMRLAGQSLLLAAAMTTGIAGAKLLNGEAKAPTQEKTDMWVEPETIAPSQQKNISEPPQAQQDQEVSPQRQQNLV